MFPHVCSSVIFNKPLVCCAILTFRSDFCSCGRSCFVTLYNILLNTLAKQKMSGSLSLYFRCIEFKTCFCITEWLIELKLAQHVGLVLLAIFLFRVCISRCVHFGIQWYTYVVQRQSMCYILKNDAQNNFFFNKLKL